MRSRWGWRLLVLTCAAWAVVLASSCRMPQLAGTPSADSTGAVYLVRHGWHAGIAVRRSDLPAGDSLFDALPKGRYLEFGWGEGRYYPDPDPGVWTLARAGLWPTRSVLHVVPIDGRPTDRFPRSTVVRIAVGPSELEALAGFLKRSFRRNEAGRPEPAAPGYYARSRFYHSPLSYHLFNNCNHWAGFGLRAAGCRLEPRRMITVGRLFDNARQCGPVVQHASD